MKGKYPEKLRGTKETLVKQALLEMDKCKPKFASTMACEAASICDRRTGARYVAKIAKEIPGITVTSVSRRTLVHRDPPGERLDQECLRECAKPIIDAYGNYMNDSYLEIIVSDSCTCRCQRPNWLPIPKGA